MKQKGLCLISGGIDSPVALFLAQKKQAEFLAIHFSIEPFTDSVPEQKSAKALKKLGLNKFFVCKVGNAFKEIASNANHKFYFVLSKRFMLKVAEKIAEKNNCSFLVTGENLGQVSSQTLSNLTAIEKAVSLPVFRPLLTMDKQEIINLAIDIGTYEISKGPETCDVLGPNKPITQTTIEKVLFEEKKINLEKLIQNCVNEVEIKKI